MDSIVATSSAYITRRILLSKGTAGFTLFVKANPSRWGIRFIGDPAASYWVTPFPGDTAAPGIFIGANDDWHTYLSRDPSLTGMAWYAYIATPIVPDVVCQAWETTPNGT